MRMSAPVSPCAAAMSPRRLLQRLPAAAHCAQAYAADRRQHRVAAPKHGGRPALPMRRACGGMRGVCPILVLVDRVQKEHPA